MRNKPKPPVVRYFLTAESVEQRNDGRLDIRGVFEVLKAAEFPARPTFFVAVSLKDVASKSKIHIRLVRPDGSKSESPAIQSMGQHLLVAFETTIGFAEPGRYQWELLSDGKPIASYELPVVQDPTLAEIAATTEEDSQ